MMANRVKTNKRTLRNLGRRGMSLFLAMVMMLSMIQIGALAASAEDIQAEKQIVFEGDTLHYNKDGTEVDSLGSNVGVSVTKTVNPTGTENLFQIDLEVVTTQDVSEISLSPDAAVVLVLDASNSMVGDGAMETITVNGVDKTQERLAWAKDAADAFLDNYVQEAGQSKRMVSVVEFGSNAKTVLGWTEANGKSDTDENGRNDVTQAALNGITAVSNKFVYDYNCETSGTHTHEESFITRATQENFRSGPNCNICGNNKWEHRHCTYADCTQRTNTEHKHAITYNGPHDPVSDSGGTNIEGGLMLARNLILDGQKTDGAIKGIENIYVILLTDGSPTFYVSDGNESTSETSFITGSTGCKNAPQGNCNNSNDYGDIPGLAADIKAATGASNPIQYGAKLYSMVYGGTEVEKDQHGNEQTYILKVNGNSIDSWLVDTVKVTHNYPSSTGGDVATNLGNIGALIGILAQAWIVTDPIPADGIVTFAESNLVNNEGEFSASNAEYLKYWDSTNNQIIWDLKQETPTKSGSKFTYSLSYNVILHSEHDDFKTETAYPTNGAAKLEYLVLEASEEVEDLTPDQVRARIHDAPFAVPTVKGYRGQFDFMKAATHLDSDEKNIYLENAPFQLTNVQNTSLEVAADAIQMNTTSEGTAEGETLGKVAFTAIPSGFNYTLSETSDSEFTSDERVYETGDFSKNITVSYGEVSPDMSDFVVRNTLKQVYGDLTITKTWNIPEGTDTQEITVYLQEGTGDSKTDVTTLKLNGATASSSDSAISVRYDSEKSTATKWVYKVNVPTINQATGGTYVYSVTEEDLGDGYTTTYGDDGLSITNTTTGKTSISVEKQWLPIDGEDVRATMPDVKVTLYRTSKTYPKAASAGTATLTKDGWTHTWNELEAYDDMGQPYTYYVEEANGTYQQIGSVTGSGTSAAPFVLTNTVLEGSIDKTVTKTWKDGNAADRPSITVELLQDGEVFRTQTLDATYVLSDNPNVWSYTFEDLPQYDIITENGTTTVHEYKYTVKEQGSVDGYATIQNGDLGLTNTRKQIVDLTVNKVWDDIFTDHDEVTIQLYRNGEKLGEAVSTENGTAQFIGLEQFDANGVAYTYTVQEVNIPARYEVTYDYGTDEATSVIFGDDHTGSVTVTNTLVTDDEELSIQINKVWQHPTGTKAPKVEFVMHQFRGDTEVYDDTYTLTPDTTVYTISGLPKYYYKQVETDDGLSVEEYEYTYTITENPIDGYNSDDGVQDSENPNQWTFTNTITGTIDDLTVEKDWVDLATNTHSATINLLRTDGTVKDGSLVYEKVDSWTTTEDATHEWGELPMYNDLGQLYTYKVEEESVPSYSVSYSPTDATYTDSVKHIVVTNTLTQDATGSYTVTKTWVDNSNDQNTRKAITLNLLRNSVSLGSVVIDAAGTLVTGEGAGTYTGAVTVTPNGDSWTIAFTGLKKYSYADGSVTEYQYSVTEDPVEGYTASITGRTVVNTLAQDSVSLKLTKNWIDPVGYAHPNATFTLNATVGGQAFSGTVTAADGTSVTLPMDVTLGAGADATAPSVGEGEDIATADTWTYTWSSLPKYTNDQKLITYSVTEKNVDGYTSSSTGNTFTNTIAQEYLDFDGEKIWDMTNKEEDDVIKPDPQPAVIALYYLNTDGTLGQMVNLDGVENPVTVVPEGSIVIKGEFSFKNLPKYNLSTGDEYTYTVREVEVTTDTDGNEGYTAVANDGVITFGLEGQGQYTVTYDESAKTPVDGENNGTNTTVTNTYSDPERYFYQITGDYVTYFTNSKQQIYTAQNVQLLERQEVDSPDTITAAVENYTEHNGVDFVYDAEDDTNVISVTLDEENKLYTIHINYVRYLYKLDVEYVFEDANDKPATGYENYTEPNWTAPEDDESYTDPGSFLGDDLYSGTYKAPPAGFIVKQVTVKDSAADAYTVSKNYDGGQFHDYDVKVVYLYARDVKETPDVTTPSFTVKKVDNTGSTITSSAATFQLYSDAECTTEVEGKSFSTSANGTTTISASQLGVGTWYLKEKTAPVGYIKGNTTWKIVVDYSESQVLEGSQFVNKQVWTMNVTELNGETSALTNGVLTVANTIITTEVSGTKTWNDANNQDGKRPASITVNLLADGAKVDSKSVTADDNWAYSFPNLPKYKDGKEIAYTVTEDPVAGYTTSYNGHNIINSYTPGKTSVTVNKIWADANNQDGIRPTSITVNLLADGVKVDSADLTAANGWTYTFSDLDEKKGGQDISYTVTEQAVEGYKTTINGYDITNTHTPATTEVKGTKTWKDSNDQDGKRPGSITVNLLADGVQVDSKKVSADDNWAYSFPNLPKYKSGVEIVYTVTEQAVAGYSTSYNGHDIINSYTPGKTSVTVNKIWADANDQDGIRPDSITVNLLANGVKVDSADLTADTGWTYTFSDLAEKKGGQTISYTVTEQAVEGYEATINGHTITNTHKTATTSVTVNKVWDDKDNQYNKRPDSVTVNLLADGTQLASATLNDANSWTYTFATLDKYADGTEIVYTVTEAPVSDYTAAITGDAATGYTITNTCTYVPEAPQKPSTTKVSVNKVWDDDNNLFGNRPDSITVNLLANGTQVASVTLSDSNGWAHTFTSLDVKQNGQTISYTVTESAVDYYTAKITGNAASGYTITNSHVVSDYEDIPETPIPESPATPVEPPVEIPEDDVPMADVPATGDNLMLWVLAAAVSGIGLIWNTISGKKKEEETV